MADACNLRACSDGLTYDRWTAFKLMEGTYNMPGTRRFTLLADNVDFRRRLRQAHPDTEGTCLQRRKDCFQVRVGMASSRVMRVPIEQCCQTRAGANCTRPVLAGGAVLGTQMVRWRLALAHSLADNNP